MTRPLLPFRRIGIGLARVQHRLVKPGQCSRHTQVENRQGFAFRIINLTREDGIDQRPCIGQ